MLSNDYIDVMKKRRSIYNITNSAPLSEQEITGLIEQALLLTPSAFNNQNAKVAVLYGKSSDALWDIVMDTLRKIVPPDNFASTEEKINSFKAGFGTILFFKDDAVTKSLQKDFPLYADNFPVWADQANGMLQLNIWQLLAANNIGASLQHYNPLIDDAVAEKFDIPKDWVLTAQMPFGSFEGMPPKKDKLPMSERMMVFA